MDRSERDVLRRSEGAGACPSQYDLRRSRYFGTSPGFWLRPQPDHELMRAARENGEPGGAAACGVKSSGCNPDKQVSERSERCVVPIDGQLRNRILERQALLGSSTLRRDGPEGEPCFFVWFFALNSF